MSETGLRCELREGVLWLTLDRPRVNALNAPLERAMIAALDAAGADGAVRAVVLSSANDRVFSAGADLKEAVEPALRAQLLLDTLIAIAACPKPVVACVAGKAVGGGAMLVVMADEIICGPGGELSLPEIQHDMPTPIGAAILAARGSHALVQKLVQAGEALGAEAALAASLVTQVVPADALHEAAQSRAAHLGTLPARAYAGNKSWINAGLIAQLRAAAAHGAGLRAKD